MKSIAKFSQLILLAVCGLIAPLFAWADGAVPLDKVVVIVNNSVITQSQLQNNIEMVKQQLQAAGKPVPSDAALRQKALDQAIGQTLQLQVAKRVKITASDADVTKAIGQIAQQNKLTVDQLKEALTKEGISYTQFRSQIHDQMILHQVQQQALAGKVHVSDADVKAYLKRAPAPNNPNVQYHLEDLLVLVGESATASEQDAATKQANDLLQKARGGSSLSQLAQDAGPKVAQYTDLQWRTVNQLPAIFANELPKLKAGDVSALIKAPNGLHIIRLVEAQGQAKPLTMEQARQMVLQQKVQEQADIWVQELRKTAYIKIM